MAQTWHIPLLTTDTLSDSRGYLNDALAALRSSFSGSSAPSSPVAGQLFLDTDDNLLYVYNGSSWAVVGDADLNYLGALPRQGGASYAMGGDFYMGSHRIKGVTDPAESGDAVTKNYGDTTYLAKAGGTMAGNIAMGANDVTCDHNPTDPTHFVRKAYADLFLPLAGGTMTGDVAMGSHKITGLPAPSTASEPVDKGTFDGKFDLSTGHCHTGGTGDSKKIAWTSLNTGTYHRGELLGADGAGGTVGMSTTSGYDDTTDALSTTYVTAAETIAYVHDENQYVTLLCTAWVSCNVEATSAEIYAWDLRIRRDYTQIVERQDVHCHVAAAGVANNASGTMIVFSCVDKPGAAGDYTYDFQLKLGYSGMPASSMTRRVITALMPVF